MGVTVADTCACYGFSCSSGCACLKIFACNLRAISHKYQNDKNLQEVLYLLSGFRSLKSYCTGESSKSKTPRLARTQVALVLPTEKWEAQTETLSSPATAWCDTPPRERESQQLSGWKCTPLLLSASQTSLPEYKEYHMMLCIWKSCWNKKEYASLITRNILLKKIFLGQKCTYWAVFIRLDFVFQQKWRPTCSI